MVWRTDEKLPVLRQEREGPMRTTEISDYKPLAATYPRVAQTVRDGTKYHIVYSVMPALCQECGAVDVIEPEPTMLNIRDNRAYGTHQSTRCHVCGTRGTLEVNAATFTDSLPPTAMWQSISRAIITQDVQCDLRWKKVSGE